MSIYLQLGLHNRYNKWVFRITQKVFDTLLVNTNALLAFDLMGFFTGSLNYINTCMTMYILAECPYYTKTTRYTRTMDTLLFQQIQKMLVHITSNSHILKVATYFSSTAAVSLILNRKVQWNRKLSARSYKYYTWTINMVHIFRNDAMECCSEFMDAMQTRKAFFLRSTGV